MCKIKQGWAWTYLFKMVKTNIDQQGKALDMYEHKDSLKDQELTGGHSQYVNM